jgi:hypothetical protein
VDGTTSLPGVDAVPGQWITAVVADTVGVDLVAVPTDPGNAASAASSMFADSAG